MERLHCPNCEESELHKLIDLNNRIRYYCYKCEEVFVLDKNTNEFIT